MVRHYFMYGKDMISWTLKIRFHIQLRHDFMNGKDMISGTLKIRFHIQLRYDSIYIKAA